jgi:hypothetical protein
VDRADLSAKFWHDPDVRLTDNRGYKRHELRDIERLLRQNLDQLREKWDEFCNSNDVADAG